MEEKIQQMQKTILQRFNRLEEANKLRYKSQKKQLNDQLETIVDDIEEKIMNATRELEHRFIMNIQNQNKNLKEKIKKFEEKYFSDIFKNQEKLMKKLKIVSSNQQEKKKNPSLKIIIEGIKIMIKKLENMVKKKEEENETVVIRKLIKEVTKEVVTQVNSKTAQHRRNLFNWIKRIEEDNQEILKSLKDELKINKKVEGETDENLQEKEKIVKRVTKKTNQQNNEEVIEKGNQEEKPVIVHQMEVIKPKKIGKIIDKGTQGKELDIVNQMEKVNPYKNVRIGVNISTHAKLNESGFGWFYFIDGPSENEYLVVKMIYGLVMFKQKKFFKFFSVGKSKQKFINLFKF